MIHITTAGTVRREDTDDLDATAVNHSADLSTINLVIQHGLLDTIGPALNEAMERARRHSATDEIHAHRMEDR